MNKKIELTQDEIQISNLKSDYLCRHYRNSPPKSLGQVLSFIYVFCGFENDCEKYSQKPNIFILMGVGPESAASYCW